MINRVTQADVAKRAGVHVTTVSMALRNHRSLPVATRQRIQALAEQMGYKPDPVLGALMVYRKNQRHTETTGTLGYITNWDAEWSWKKLPAHAEFFSGATAKAAELGFHLEHFWLGEAGLSHRRMSDILLSRGITGLILASWHPNLNEDLRFDWPKFSAVKIDYLPQSPKLHNVSNDQRSVIQLAIRQIKAAGYRRIGSAMPRWWDQYVGRAWSAGFLAEQNDCPEDERIPLLFFEDDEFLPSEPGKFIETTTQSKLAKWMQQYRPEVILGYGPFIRPQLASLGISIPGDVAFVDCHREDDDLGTAGVHENCLRVGELAVEILAGQLQRNQFGLPQFQTTSLVEGTWVEGASLPPCEPSRRVTAKNQSQSESNAV